jgi:hypothetical protein
MSIAVPPSTGLAPRAMPSPGANTHDTCQLFNACPVRSGRLLTAAQGRTLPGVEVEGDPRPRILVGGGARAAAGRRGGGRAGEVATKWRSHLRTSGTAGAARGCGDNVARLEEWTGTRPTLPVTSCRHKARAPPPRLARGSRWRRPRDTRSRTRTPRRTRRAARTSTRRRGSRHTPAAAAAVAPGPGAATAPTAHRSRCPLHSPRLSSPPSRRRRSHQHPPPRRYIAAVLPRGAAAGREPRTGLSTPWAVRERALRVLWWWRLETRRARLVTRASAG